MACARRHHQRILEQRLWYNVIRDALAQRADQEVDVAVAQVVQEIGVGAVDDTDFQIGLLARQRVDCRRQDGAARERHAAHHDPAGVHPARCGDFGHALRKLGEGQLGVLREQCTGTGQPYALAGLLEQVDVEQALKVARRAMQREGAGEQMIQRVRVA